MYGSSGMSKGGKKVKYTKKKKVKKPTGGKKSYGYGGM